MVLRRHCIPGRSPAGVDPRGGVGHLVRDAPRQADHGLVQDEALPQPRPVGCHGESRGVYSVSSPVSSVSHS